MDSSTPCAPRCEASRSGEEIAISAAATAGRSRARSEAHERDRRRHEDFTSRVKVIRQGRGDRSVMPWTTGQETWSADLNASRPRRGVREDPGEVVGMTISVGDLGAQAARIPCLSLEGAGACPRSRNGGSTTRCQRAEREGDVSDHGRAAGNGCRDLARGTKTMSGHEPSRYLRWSSGRARRRQGGPRAKTGVSSCRRRACVRVRYISQKAVSVVLIRR